MKHLMLDIETLQIGDLMREHFPNVMEALK